MIKYLEDARIFGSERQGCRVQKQRVRLDGACEALCKAVSIIKKLVEVRITS